MKPVEPSEFERNCAEAAGAPDVYETPVIRTQMNRRDWLILLGLAVIWGGAFFFIGVAVRHVPPLTYVWLRLTIAAAAMWAYLGCKRRAHWPAAIGLGLDPPARLAQQCRTVRSVRLGRRPHRQRPRCDPQRHHADLGRGRRAFPRPTTSG